MTAVPNKLLSLKSTATGQPYATASRDHHSHGVKQRDEKEDVQYSPSLSVAGAHFQKKQTKEKLVVTTMKTGAAQKLVTEEGADASSNMEDEKMVPEEKEDPYRRMSAAGEHFARRKSLEGSSSPSLRGVLSRMKSSFTLHYSAEEEAVDEKGLDVNERHSVKEAKQMEVKTNEDIDKKKDSSKHLSVAGEHFSPKKGAKKVEKPEAPVSVEQPKEEDDSDRYKHLSAAGEHFARRKSEGDSPSLLKRMASSLTRQNSADTNWSECEGGEDEDTDRYKHMSSAGEHFARQHAEKKAARAAKRASRVEKKMRSSLKKESGGETKGHGEAIVPVESYDVNVVSTADSSENFPGTIVREVMASNTSDDEKDYVLDSLDHIVDMVAQTLCKGILKDEEVEDEPQSPSINTPASLFQLDEIQRTPAYTIHRDLVIGKGSYGQVYIASRGEAEGYYSSKPGYRKKYACKSVSLKAHPKYIYKLQEEVNVLRILRGHENVIRLYDVFVLDTEVLIVTELGKGGDLFHLLATHPKMGLSEEYAGKIFTTLL